MSLDKNNSKRKRIGWLCAYVPEELIMAAGMEPVRLQGEMENVKEADSYLFSNVCPYVKHILEAGLRERSGNLEGIIFTNSCDGMRRLHDLWGQYIGTPFTYMLDIPKHRDEKGIEYFSDQLLDLKTKLEEVTEKDISDHELGNAISHMNNRREMIMDLFERQKEVPSRYRGSDLLDLCLEETRCPKDETTQRIQDMAEQLNTTEYLNDRPERILVTGNVIDKPNLFKIVESAGAEVVAFDNCLGLRHYTDPVEGGNDLIRNLARRYLLRPPCSRMPGLDEKIERLGQLSQDYSIDGIIQSTVKFCDFALLETPVLEDSVKSRNLPFLSIENDYLWADEGRIKIRVEAFLEMIRESD